MSILDGFTEFDMNPERPFASFTVNGVTFSKMAIEILGCPEYVKLLIDKKDRQFAIKPSSKDGHALAFQKKLNKGGRVFVRWNNKKVTAPLKAMLSQDPDRSGVRVYGEYYEEENCIIFDCKNTEKVER